jgi:hypothetical protein
MSRNLKQEKIHYLCNFPILNYVIDRGLKEEILPEINDTTSFSYIIDIIYQKLDIEFESYLKQFLDTVRTVPENLKIPILWTSDGKPVEKILSNRKDAMVLLPNKIRDLILKEEKKIELYKFEDYTLIRLVHITEKLRGNIFERMNKRLTNDVLHYEETKNYIHDSHELSSIIKQQ